MPIQSRCIYFVLTYYLFIGVDAFAPSPLQCHGRTYAGIRRKGVFSSSIEQHDISEKRKKSYDRKSKETEYMEELRQELIAKYIAAGRSLTAETEVDTFLRDTQRSDEYIQMKLRAKEESELGFEEFIRYAIAFSFGVLYSLAANYYLDLHEVRKG